MIEIRLLMTLVFFLGNLAGCASAPKPPECKGEFKPINKIEGVTVKQSGLKNTVRCAERESHGNKG